MDARTVIKGTVAIAYALTISDVSAESVTLAWDRAASHTNLSAFVLKWGTQSGRYSDFLEVDPSLTTVTVNNLPPGVRYYFVVTARNLAALESDPSNEVSYAPGYQPVSMQIQNTLLSALVMKVTGHPSQSITIEMSDSPDGAMWSPVYTGRIGVDGTATYIHATSSGARGFFRCRYS